MKKKLFMGIAICALSASCIFGITACNNGENNVGNNGGNEVETDALSIQVTEAEWEAAFERTNALLSPSNTARNVTLSTKVNSTYTAEGVTHVFKLHSIACFVGNEEYVKQIDTDEGVQSMHEIYALYEGTNEYQSISENGGWVVEYKTHYESDSDEPVLETPPYSDFAYNDGKYIRTYKTEYEAEVTHTVKINADGYIFYMSSEEFMEDGYSQIWEYDFYDFGKTTLNVPAEAKQAIKDYKAENN